MVIRDNIAAHSNNMYEYYCESAECTQGRMRGQMEQLTGRYLLWPRVVELKGNFGAYDSDLCVLCEECATKAGIIW